MANDKTTEVWARALGSVVADIRQGKNGDADKALGTLAVSLLDKRDEIERLRTVVNTMAVNLERGSSADAVAAWGREQINE